MMQTDRPHVVLEYDCLDDPQIPEDQPLLGSPFTHSETHSQHGLTIITCTASVLFIASAINNLVALNITQHSSEFGLDPGVELW